MKKILKWLVVVIAITGCVLFWLNIDRPRSSPLIQAKIVHLQSACLRCGLDDRIVELYTPVGQPINALSVSSAELGLFQFVGQNMPILYRGRFDLTERMMRQFNLDPARGSVCRMPYLIVVGQIRQRYTLKFHFPDYRYTGLYFDAKQVQIIYDTPLVCQGPTVEQLVGT